MSQVEDFLTKKQEAEIVCAIQQAEKNTSGEIRVHLEEYNDVPTVERAKEIFFKLGMDKTAARNGVLIYVNVFYKSFAILGDEGINQKVGDFFWENTKNIMKQHFANGFPKTALVEGIKSCGEQLKHFFPYEKDDIDELSNELSKS